MDASGSYDLILGLVLANDWRIFDDVASKHPHDLPRKNAKEYREVGEALTFLLETYDFTESVAFQRSVAGKGAAYVEAKRRIESEPVKRLSHRARFANSLQKLLTSDEAYDLLPPTHHPFLKRILVAISRLEGGV